VTFVVQASEEGAMTKLRLVAAAMLGLASFVPAGNAVMAKPKPKPVTLTISNFRFCKAASCTVTDVGYLRSDSGPVSGTDNSRATVDVRTGATVVWTYKDTQCDGAQTEPLSCPGHNIWFESPGRKIGFAAARSGPSKITTKITGRPGSTIRYYCSVNNHYLEGMTGILRVVR
jgi:hypothetical protein